MPTNWRDNCSCIGVFLPCREGFGSLPPKCANTRALTAERGPQLRCTLSRHQAFASSKRRRPGGPVTQEAAKRSFMTSVTGTSAHANFACAANAEPPPILFPRANAGGASLTSGWASAPSATTQRPMREGGGGPEQVGNWSTCGTGPVTGGAGEVGHGAAPVPAASSRAGRRSVWAPPAGVGAVMAAARGAPGGGRHWR
jgi:hypothetical protein